MIIPILPISLIYIVIYVIVNKRKTIPSAYIGKTNIKKYLINEFYKSLNHYTEKFNTKIVYVDLGYDIGKICHECGALTHDDSSNILHCDCGATVDKDLNAGINLLSYLINKCGLKNRFFFKKENVKQLELF